MNLSATKVSSNLGQLQYNYYDFISPRSKKWIRVSVMGFHIAVIFVPFFWLLFMNWLNPPRELHKINLSLIDMPFDFPSTGTTKGAPAPPPKEIAPVAEAPQDPPTPELPVPEETPQEQPKVIEPPKIKEPKKEPPKKEPPKKEPAVVKEPKREPPKKEPPKKEPLVIKPTTTVVKKDVKKDDKKFVPITPEDIQKSNTTVVKGPKGDPNAKNSKRVDPNSVYKGDPLDNKITDNTPVGNAGGGPNTAQLTDYYDSVSQLLYRMWQQPGKNLLGGAKPFVTVKISVDAVGKIVSARITKRSGIAIMDNSVERLLSEVTVLPKPPQAMDFDATLKIDEE